MQDKNEQIVEKQEVKITFQDLKNELFKCLEGRHEKKVASLIFKQYRIDSIEKVSTADSEINCKFIVNYSSKHTNVKYTWDFA